MEVIFARMNEEPTILKFMDDHIKQLKPGVGKDYTQSTFEKYVFIYDKVAAFIRLSLN